MGTFNLHGIGSFGLGSSGLPADFTKDVPEPIVAAAEAYRQLAQRMASDYVNKRPMTKYSPDDPIIEHYDELTLPALQESRLMSPLYYALSKLDQKMAYMNGLMRRMYNHEVDSFDYPAVVKLAQKGWY